jgi:hypothetical protein
MSRRAAVPPRRLGRASVEVLQSLHQHRLLTTRQVHRLHAPGASRRWTQELLHRLASAGLAGMAREARGGGAWHLTAAGLDAAETIPVRAEERRKLVTPAQAAGPLQQHTLEVNEVGLAFVEAARSRGDDFGPFAWRHEISHRLSAPGARARGENLIADALLVYQQGSGGRGTTFHYRLLELDRATMSAAQLASRLARYGRLHRVPGIAEDPVEEPGLAWERTYPVFPAVIVALSGAGREALGRRRETVLALLAEEPDLQGVPEVEISACLLEDLVGHGPFAPIFRRRGDPVADVDWVGESA